MSLAFQRNERRRCSRCNLPLEDPASEELGYGPICARKNVTLMAKTIPANYPMALAIVFGMKQDSLPAECQEKFVELKEILIQRGSHAVNSTPESDGIHAHGEDLRKVIRHLDWILSFKMEQTTRNYLVSVVSALGYGALAAVLSQEASTSPAELSFENGVFQLKGASCKSGFLEMRKISGVLLPEARGKRLPFVAPARLAEPFLTVVQKYWPFYEIVTESGQPLDGKTIDSLIQEAALWAEANPTAEPPAPKIASPGKALVKTEGDWVKFSFHWNFSLKTEMYAIVDQIKRIPWKERKFDPATKQWSVKAQHKPLVLSILSSLFEIEELND